MLTAIRKLTNQKVMARDAERGDSGFLCRGCGADVTLHKGSIRIHHFKHKPSTVCVFSRPESQQHLSVKLALYDRLRELGRNVELEVWNDGRRPDLLVLDQNQRVAIEVQKSALAVTELRQRTKDHHSAGLSILWVVPAAPPQPGDVIRVNAWQKEVHKWGFGLIFFATDSGRIHPVHFQQATRYVEEREVYDRDYGAWQTVGGYKKALANQRVACPAPQAFDIHELTSKPNKHADASIVTVPYSRSRWWDTRRHPQFKFVSSIHSGMKIVELYGITDLKKLLDDKNYYFGSEHVWINLSGAGRRDTQDAGIKEAIEAANVSIHFMDEF